MENASKALLIAASLLIVILLIAMEMRIFNSTSGTTDQVEGTMQTTEVAMFNSKFMQYIGNNKSKTDVLSLWNLVTASYGTGEKIGMVIYTDALANYWSVGWTSDTYDSGSATIRKRFRFI